MKQRQPKVEKELQTVTQNNVTRFIFVPKWKVPLTFHTSERFTDYLHGDVPEDEARAACLYEYARESRILWEAAEMRDAWITSGRDAERAELRAWGEIALRELKIFPQFTASFLACGSFPKKDWQELTRDDRRRIMRFGLTVKTQPLPMPDAWTLKAMGTLDKFKEMGEKAEPVIEDVPPGQTGKPVIGVPAILQERGSVFHAIFTLDFSKGEAQLVNEFREWLRLRENRGRLQEFKRPRVGAPGESLDRLKDLAAWRLFRELNNNWNAANEYANDHRKLLTAPEIAKKYKNKTATERKGIKAGSPKPFRDAKPHGGNPPNEAALFGGQPDAYKAKASASEYLMEILPMEFPPPPGPLMQAALDEIDKLQFKE